MLARDDMNPSAYAHERSHAKMKKQLCLSRITRTTRIARQDSSSVSLLAFITLIGSVVNLYQSWGDHQRLYSASLILVLAVCAFMTPRFVRLSTLKAQDRAVRAEENLRYYIATGKPLDPRLSLGQIIALRFASDAEYVDLYAEPLAEGWLRRTSSAPSRTGARHASGLSARYWLGASGDGCVASARSRNQLRSERCSSPGTLRFHTRGTALRKHVSESHDFAPYDLPRSGES